MRIAVDARPLNHPRSGIGRYTRELLQRLLASGKHRWFLYVDRPPEPLPTLPGAVLRSLQNTHRLAGAAAPHLRFWRWAQQDRADLYWSPRHVLPCYLPPELATALTLHDLVFLSHPETMTRAGRWQEQLTTRRSLARATRVLTTTAAVRDQARTLLAVPDSRLHTIPLGSTLINPAVRQPTMAAPLPAQPFALYCGSMEPRKNLDRLIRAFVAMKASSGVPHRLVIVTGGGWREAPTRALIARHADTVALIENASDAHKTRLFAACSFVVQPSLSEGFGLSVVDALHAGKPLLCADAGALPEVAGAAALYTDPLDERAIGDGLRRLATDTALLARLADQARRRAGLFDWSRCAEQTLSALEAAVQHPDQGDR